MTTPAALPIAAQTAVVTGAASGVGREIARVLHRAGYRVVLTDIDVAACNQLAEELDDAAETVLASRLDIAQPEDFQRVLERAVERWGSVEVLVNNAAITAAGPLLDVESVDFDRVLQVNAGGTFSGSRIFGRYFKARGYGRIVNLASLAGQNGGTATGVHYAASKGAILTLTKVFARDLGPFGVTVNAIAPGPLDTPMVHSVLSDAALETLVSAIPVRQLGSAGFVGEIVSLLASPNAAFVNGACWDANGGLFMR